MRSILLIPVLAATAAAQQVPTRTLAKPEIEYGEPFSQLNSLFEMRDGRVIAADSRDKTLQAIDLRAGKATPIGREGAGPDEWGLVNGVFGWLADSVIANDLLNGRYLIISPAGKPVRTYNPIADAVALSGPPAARGGDGGRGAAGGDGGRGGGRATDGRGNVVDGRGGLVLGPGGRGGPANSIIGGGQLGGVDARGRFYSQQIGFTLNQDGNIVSSDSAPIVRFDPVSNKRDTIAYVNLAKGAASGRASGSGGNSNVSIRIGGSAPFAAADDWTVFRDGTVAIVRVADYHVELIPPSGRRVAGRPVAFTPVKVAEADKQQWRDQQKNRTGVVRTIGGGGGGSPQGATQLPPVQEPSEWPATKPPFVGRASYAAPNGELWVVRARSATDKVPTADVFSAQGQLIGRVALPASSRLVALGPKGVYVARIDDDDLQYLQRHAINWGTCVPELRESCAAK